MVMHGVHGYILLFTQCVMEILLNKCEHRKSRKSTEIIDISQILSIVI